MLRHQGRLTTFDWSGEKGRTNIQWAAFYSDCEHEVLEVTAGQRVTLTYNLFATCWANTAWVDAERIELCQTLKTLISQPGFCKSGEFFVYLSSMKLTVLGAKIGFHCVHAYPHTNGEVIDTLPTTLKGVDKIMYECFFATRAKVGMRHILNTGDFENLGYESNDLFRQSLQGAHTEDMSRFEDLLKHYHRGEVQDWRGNKHEGWTRKDKYQDWNYIPEDTYAVTANLTPFHFTKVGMNQEDTESIVDAWNPGYKVEATHWLNEQSKSEMALVHGAVSVVFLESRFSLTRCSMAIKQISTPNMSRWQLCWKFLLLINDKKTCPKSSEAHVGRIYYIDLILMLSSLARLSMKLSLICCCG